AELLRRAAVLMGDGLSVVLDATFLSERLRLQAIEMSQEQGAISLFAWCECPREIALERISRRQQQGTDASEARPELYDRQAAEQAPLSDKVPAVRIDTTAELPTQLAHVFAQLRRLREDGTGEVISRQ
ncbi:MAG: AAA family ATPase, partial [Planctomycetes bacterium]|nr:AAA family ATPase [Planctomycetota bacterium]